MTKVFIVDDHYMVIEGIRSLLQHEKSVELTGHAMTAASCMAFLQNQVPDIILMDINLPDKSGIELCREVKQKFPGIFIIGLSTFNQESFIRQMMDHGASGYVLKNASQAELMEAISAVSRGKIYFSGEAAQSMHKTDSHSIILTRREKEVIELIAAGLTNNDIGKKLFISPTTVDTHRRNLLIKLNAKNTAELVKIAFLNKLIEGGD